VTSTQPFVHDLAIVEDDVTIGPGTRVWANAHVRRGARIGAGCVIGAGATIDIGVRMGDHCKVQNAALLYHGVELHDGVFIGPGAVLTNDRRPRAIAASGAPLGDGDWTLAPIVVEEGASLGANSTVVAGTRIGRWALVGAGAVVVRDVPPFALMMGVPARQAGWVCACGARTGEPGRTSCDACR
jgi:UDP-2-acetamido-3-amino-2,3-dideoxy-glucuronate N-acetyltransferase